MEQIKSHIAEVKVFALLYKWVCMSSPSPGLVTQACNQAGQQGVWTLVGLLGLGWLGRTLARPIQVES
ncbi:hypothetical protein OWV82_001483 [Melia azedarach]|uniref:Uncharacterized protein n=1 Tax=Melia azedarach TaxID=155640 RepID=A0ACC1YXP7_MELAZ|nr:hypothetical protein OWV82_001483 [Melia azedarach]